MPGDCVFCRIAAGEVPARTVLETPEVVAFHDLHPQAPLHLLVIPRRHVASLAECSAAEATLLGDLLVACSAVAAAAGVAEAGYRVVLNTNTDGGQTVPHLHAHVLAGRHMGWPPG
jgi:histidine triad (HIT) family protein